MKIYNGKETRQTNKFGINVQKKVAAFIYWVHVLQRIQEPIIYTFWKQPQLVLSVRELEVEVSCAKSDPVDIKVVKIDVGWGWNEWKERFVAKMGSTTGVDGVLQKYITHKINPQGWVASCDTNTYEYRLIYSVTIHGIDYDTYNRAVWHKIQN